ncbi:MAG: nucleotidyltransferase family protein [Spongiibacteraceae bacterium]
MHTPHTPIALVLAAGFARRFGSDKRLARLSDGTTVLETVITSIRAADLEVIVALRESDHTLRRHFPTALTIADETSLQGMGSSLAAAVAQLPDDRHCMICLGDMPFVTTATYATLAAAANGGQIICPQYRGQRGNPVIFGADFLAELRTLSGDSGAKKLLQKYAERVIDIKVDDAGIHRDIDTPKELP